MSEILDGGEIVDIELRDIAALFALAGLMAWQDPVDGECVKLADAGEASFIAADSWMNARAK